MNDEAPKDQRRVQIDLSGDSKRGIHGVNEFVKSRVAKYYWEDDINCATTTLNILVGVRRQLV